MRAFCGAGGEDDGRDAGLGEISLMHRFANLLSVLCFAEGHRRSTEAAAGHAGSNDSREGGGDFDHEVELFAGDFEVVSERRMRVGHKLADVGQVACFESGDSVLCSLDFAHDVA